MLHRLTPVAVCRGWVLLTAGEHDVETFWFGRRKEKSGVASSMYVSPTSQCGTRRLCS